MDEEPWGFIELLMEAPDFQADITRKAVEKNATAAKWASRMRSVDCVLFFTVLSCVITGKTPDITNKLQWDSAGFEG